jgi:hypothetical protein
MLVRNPWLMGDGHHTDSAEVFYDYLRKSCERQHYGVPDDEYRRVNDQVGWGRANAARAMVASCKMCGDADGDGSRDVADAVFLIQFIFAGGPPPGDCVNLYGRGDANGDEAVDIGDAVYLIQYVFAGGPYPRCP